LAAKTFRAVHCFAGLRPHQRFELSLRHVCSIDVGRREVALRAI
jgi:hypothetical protein